MQQQIQNLSGDGGAQNGEAHPIVEKLKSRVAELEKVIEREVAGREIELTLQGEEFASADELHRQNIEELQRELSEYQQKDAERSIMEKEIKLLRERVINVNDEVSAISRQSEDEISGIRRRQFRIAIQLEEQFRESVAGLRSKLREEVTGALDQSSKDAIATNECLQAELRGQSTIVYELLSKYKEVEAQKENLRLRATIANEERDVCAKHNVKLQQQLRKQHKLLQQALKQVEALSGQQEIQQINKVDRSPKVRRMADKESKYESLVAFGIMTKGATRKQRHRGFKLTMDRNSGTPSSLPPVKKAPSLWRANKSRGASRSMPNCNSCRVNKNSISKHDWLKAADIAIRAQHHEKAGMLGTLGLNVPHIGVCTRPYDGSTEHQREIESASVATGGFPAKLVCHRDGGTQEQEGCENDEIWRASHVPVRATRMPILTSNNVCDL